MSYRRLSSASVERKMWNGRYCRAKAKDAPVQKCAKCGESKHRDNMEPHHPFGRIKDRILAYVYLCHPCHQWVHDNGKDATAEGWLQPEFRGMPQNQEIPKPWDLAIELNWPEELKRSEAPASPQKDRPKPVPRWVQKKRTEVSGRYQTRSTYDENVDASGASTREEYLAHVREESEKQRQNLINLRREHEEHERRLRNYFKTLPVS